MALIKAVVPHFRVEDISVHCVVSSKVKAALTIPEFNLSANGIVVEAKNKLSTCDLSSSGPSNLLAASTDIVTLSSSQFAIDLVPLPFPIRFGASQALDSATLFLNNLNFGI